jgi:hypothetical protein
MDYADGRAEVRNKRAGLRRQKGWYGFVHGYKDRIKVFDEIWDDISWNDDPSKSGATSVESDGKGKTIYKF